MSALVQMFTCHGLLVFTPFAVPIFVRRAVCPGISCSANDSTLRPNAHGCMLALFAIRVHNRILDHSWDALELWLRGVHDDGNDDDPVSFEL